jgi:tetratricopeptide (TPR) repeat protein
LARVFRAESALIAAIGVLVAAGPPGPASGQTARPQAAGKSSGKKAEERKGPTGQPFAPKQFDAAKEELADKKRDEAIEQLKRIIPRIQDGTPQKADLLFQLSELYWEKQRYLALKASKRFSDDIARVEQSRQRGEKAADSKLDVRESELYRSETMRLYETILRDYPAYQRKDEVLFSLGYNLYELGKRDQAIKRYEELARNYPDSKFLADSYVQLANHWFDNNNLLKAKENYEKALKTNKPEIYAYALYKLAWCDYNAREFEAGLKKFHGVVDYADSHGRELSDLKTEALRDMVLTYARLNRPKDAVEYFRTKAPKKRQPRLITSLANELSDAGQYDSAIWVYRGLIDEEPTRGDAPELQQAIIRSYEKLRQRDQVKVEVKKLAELYRPGSTWWKANESRPNVLKDAFAVTEEAMRSVVTDYHQEAQKTKQAETYRLARDIYQQYVASFATSSNPDFVSDFAFNMRYYHADILWALEEWEAAAAEYERVVAFKIPPRDAAKEVSNPEYRKNAAYYAILAYSKLVKIERGELKQSQLKEGQKVDEKKRKGEVERQKKVTKRSVKELEQRPLTAFERKLVAACDTYTSAYPGDKDEIEVRYQAAVIHYDRNDFVEATRRFAQIIDKWPEERRSQDAADLAMGVLEEKEEWLQLNKVSRIFLANKKLAKPGTEFARRVAGVVEGSQYKYVDEVVYRREKNAPRAAELFLEFVKEFPSSDNADRALTYAMLIFQDARQIDRAIVTGERVLQEYAGTPFELKVRWALAKFYEQTAQFRKSAEMNGAFIAAVEAMAGAKQEQPPGQRPIKGRKAPAAKKEAAAGQRKIVLSAEELKALKDEANGHLADAHFNAALWWEGLGEYEKAIGAWNAYLIRFKDRPDVPAIHLNVAQLLEKQKKPAEAIKQYESFAHLYGRDKRTSPVQLFQTKYRLWRLHRELKNQKEMDRLEQEILKAHAALSPEEKQDFEARNAYAHMRFLGVEPLWKAYQDIKFTKVSTLKKDFLAKQKKIQEVEKAYTDVATVGDGEYAIAAATRIGLAYADFAQNILDSPDPKNLDPELLEMYRAELENRAFPLEEKAMEAFEKATAKAYELNLYGEWTLLAQERINKYRPGFYAKTLPSVSYQGAEFFVTAPVAKEFRAADAVPPAPPTAAARQGPPAGE